MIVWSLVWSGGKKQSQNSPGREIYVVLFVDILNFCWCDVYSGDSVVGHFFSAFLVGIVCVLLLGFGVILLSYSFVPWFLVGFSLVCFLDIALPDALWVARVFK